MKKTAVRWLVLLLLAALAVSSCSQKEDYHYNFAYPEGYTAEYFKENYLPCDRNLIHLQAAENSAGQHEENGQYLSYYAIMDVPVEKYVSCREDYIILDPSFDIFVFRNPEVEISEPEILSWTVERAELYWRNGHHFMDKKGKVSSIGEDIFHETLTEVDGAGFQTHLKTCLETEGYRANGAGCLWHTVTKRFTFNDNGSNAESDLMLTLRVHFKEYENIVWDGKVVTIEGGEHDYYVLFYLFTVTESIPEGYYRDVFVPLPAEIAELIPET